MLTIATAEDVRRLDYRHERLIERVERLEDHIHSLNRKVLDMADATQADIDNLTNQVTQIATDLTDAQAKLQAEIDSLAAQGVNVSALQDAVAPLDSAVQALGGLQPTPPPA